MNEIKLTIHPFEMDSLKESAKKVQEEAGEAFAEYVILQEQQDRSITRLADEIADVIQASCNLAARYGINLQAAMERCERRNRGRGRYEDAKPCGACGRDDCNCGGSCGDVSLGVGDLREKSPEEMTVAELIETLKATTSGFEFESRCKRILGDDWCKEFYYCFSCRSRLLNMLKAAHERESEAAIELIKDARDEYMRLRTENGIMLDEILIRQDKIDKLNQQVSDLAHERDGLRNRLAELDEAGITSLHRLLRETVGEAKNITDNARVYIDKQQGSKDEHCGSRGSVWRNHGGDCGAQCAGEYLLPVEPPAQEISERETVIERLREIDFSTLTGGSQVALSKIGYAILGESAPWYPALLTALRDKLIELIGDVNDAE